MTVFPIKNKRKAVLVNRMEAFVATMIFISAIIGLDKVSPGFSPFIFVICMGGMAGVAAVRWRTDRIERTKNVNYSQIAARDLDKYTTWLKENVRGHDIVIDSILAKLNKNIQLARPGRTLGNFMLVGPPGTGKKFLAQLVSYAMFPDPDPLILTMSQFQQPGDIQTLVGMPQGGNDAEGGKLVQGVLDNPYRVIILDEVDKAHHNLHNCLYHILDTAAYREKAADAPIDFSGCVFLATMSAGVERLRSLFAEVGYSPAWLDRSREVLAEVTGLDRAFLARWDAVYLMDQLPPLHVAEAALLELRRYWREYGIELDYVAPELIFEAVQLNRNFFAEYGVRQLGRLVREKTEPALLEARRKGSVKVNLRVAAQSGNLEVEAQR